MQAYTLSNTAESTCYSTSGSRITIFNHPSLQLSTKRPRNLEKMIMSVVENRPLVPTEEMAIWKILIEEVEMHLFLCQLLMAIRLLHIMISLPPI